MNEFESFLTTPEHQAPWPPQIAPDTDFCQEVTIVPMSGLEDIQPAWRRLLQSSLDDNPFLSPAFMIPAASHLISDTGLSLATVWERKGEERMLVGLFPLMPATRSLTGGWIGSKATLWKHAMQPFCAPLLAGPEAQAERSVQTFISWLAARRPKLSSLEASGMPVDGAVTWLVEAEARRRGLPFERRRENRHTHGLDFKPSAALDNFGAIVTATSPGDVRKALEQLLCLDAREHGLAKDRGILSYPDQAAFLRAAVRSFSMDGKVAIAMMDNKVAEAGAIIIEGRDNAYLWWIMGPNANDPDVEAAFAATAERTTGKPVIAAAERVLMGLGSQAIATEGMTMGLSPTPQSLAARMRARSHLSDQ